MKSFEEIKSIYDEEKKGFDVEKEKPEKFLISLELAEPENRVLLSENGINLKPSEWIVLTIEPEILKKTVLRAKELGFLEAYKQTPSFLKQDVDAIIKRMAHLEHLGIPYKNEKGKYQCCIVGRIRRSSLSNCSLNQSRMFFPLMRRTKRFPFSPCSIPICAVTSVTERLFLCSSE